MTRYRSALADRDLRLLFGARILSATGTWAYGVALAVWVYDRTHSLAWVAAANVVRFVPGLVLSAYAGVIAERRERIGLMARADVACTIWQALIVVLIVAHGPVVVVLALAVLTAATSVVYEPSVAATIPTFVDEDHLVAANGLRETIDGVVVVAGPAIGALLLLIGPPQWAFALNAASFGASAWLVSRIRRRSRAVDVTEGGEVVGRLRQIAVGARAIIGSRPARTLVGFSVLVSFLYGADTILFVAVSVHRLGTGPRGYGYLLAGCGVGGIAISLVIDRLSESARMAPLILAGTAGYCLPTALLTVIHSPDIAFAIQVFRGGSTLIVDVLAVIALQRAVPPDRLARAFGVFGTFLIAAVALGALVTPLLISAAGLNGALLTMAFAPLVLGLLGLPALVAIDNETRMATEQIARGVAVLDRLAIFSAGSRVVLERLASVATGAAYASGTAIVTEGQPADALYILTEGTVQISSRGERGGPEQAIATVRAPAYFGEVGLLAGIPRTATVTALGGCRCARIEGRALLDAVSSAPVSASLIEVAQSRLTATYPSQRLEPSLAQ